MRLALPLLLTAVAAACSDAAGPTAPINTATRLAAGAPVVGGVFTQSNDAAANAVIAWGRRSDGTLSYLGTYATGGTGTGSGLGSQGAVALTPDARVLLAVNGGSDELTSFRVSRDGLTRVETESSGGDRPVSVAATNHVVYVLNSASSTLAGYRIAPDGSLERVPEWTRSLSAGASGGAQVQFTRDGRLLAVVARGSSSFDVFRVHPDGSLSEPVSSPSVGQAPFGFDFTPRGQLIVSEPNPPAASSYAIGADGSLRVVSANVGAFQAAPCWVVVTRDGRFAYTANAGAGSISGFAVGADGALALLTPGGLTGNVGQGSTPLDMDVSRDSRFLYVVEGGTGSVMAFTIGNDGSLTANGEVPSPAGARARNGMAAY